jgi:hypothetical protein
MAQEADRSKAAPKDASLEEDDAFEEFASHGKIGTPLYTSHDDHRLSHGVSRTRRCCTHDAAVLRARQSHHPSTVACHGRMRCSKACAKVANFRLYSNALRVVGRAP